MPDLQTMYNPKVMDHFMHPRNMGKMDDATHKAQIGNPVCGDVLELYLKIKNGKIEKASFLAFGCGAAIAGSSVLTEMLKGKTIKEAMAIKNLDVAEALGGLPKEKIHCSVLARQAVEKALKK